MSFRPIAVTPTSALENNVKRIGLDKIDTSLQTFSHYSDVIMGAMASQITGVLIVCSTFCSGAHQRKHQCSASPAFVMGIHRWPVDSPHKEPVTPKLFPFDDVIMQMHFLEWKVPCVDLNFTFILRVFPGAQLTKHFHWRRLNIKMPSCQYCQYRHYIDVIMTTMASQITGLTVVYSTIYSDAYQRKHQRSASLAFVWGIHRYRWIPRTKGQLRGKCFHLIWRLHGI